MPIQLMSAILAQRAFKDPDGNWHIINPAKPLIIDPKNRAGQQVAASIDCIAAVTLWGGQEGQEFALTTGLSSPTRPAVNPSLQRLSWGKAPSCQAFIDINLKVAFDQSGVWKMKFLVDGEPVGELPVPIFWADEYPP